MTTVVFASCGEPFHTGPEDARAGAASYGAAGGGGEANGGGAAGGGGEANGGASPVLPSAGATVGGAPGGGGAGGDPSCSGLDGQQFDGHCYVDVTTESVSHPDAVAACESLAASSGFDAHLLVLDSAAEQDFVLRSFLSDFTDVSDAWLGLTCTEQAHPSITDCYCTECTAEKLSEKQDAWRWLDGTRAHFGWVNANPNGALRCAALAYNPEVKLWGWVDRACDLAEVTPIAGHPHTYRTLCELEP
jgi:hypothetical protein